MQLHDMAATRPPSSENWTALLSGFVITCCSRISAGAQRFDLGDELDAFARRLDAHQLDDRGADRLLGENPHSTP